MKLITRFSDSPYEHKAALPPAATWTEQQWLQWADDDGKRGIYQDYLALTAGYTPEQLAEFWAEPEPPAPIPVPDWQGWQLAMFANTNFIPVFQAVPTVVTATLTTLIGQVQDKPETVSSIAAIWSQLSVPTEVRDEWRVIAENFHLPEAFIEVI